MVFFPNRFISEFPAARKASIFSSQGWWLNRWPLLGWLETFVKIFAWSFVPAATTTTSTTTSTTLSAEEFAQAAILGVASLLLAAAVVDRLVYRELVSIIFVFPNNWAHWSLFLALVRHGSSNLRSAPFRAFLWLMFAGDVIKLVFFSVHGFEIKAIAKVIVYSLVLLFALMYAAVLAIDYGHFRPVILRFHAFFLQRMPSILKAINAR